MNFHIKQPDSEDEFRRYYQLRWQILRAPWNQAIGSEVDDIEDQCFHLMALSPDDEVIGVARLQFNTTTEAQIRYMAVSEKHERKGIGRELVHRLEQHARKKSYKNIMLDAREPAVKFYQRLGYKISGKSYLLFDLIQHFRMMKAL